ncbi:MAG: hypothetical protein N3A01_09100 [Bacteroidales bacterium]|nr:hypothetical protein [Bacteroidales bacterium]
MKKYITIILIFIVSISKPQFLTVSPKLSKENCLIGDTVTLFLKITSTSNEKIIFPFKDTLTKNILITNFSKTDTISYQNNTVELLQKLTLAVFDTGNIKISPLPLYVMKDTIIDTIYTDTIRLTVNLLPVDTIKQKIFDIKPPLDEPFSFKEILEAIWLFLKKYWYLIILGIIFITLTAMLIYIYIRKKQNKPLFPFLAKPQDPPFVVALKALDALKEKRLWQKQLYKPYYTELTDILRIYLEKQFNIPAMESLSYEIIQHLEKNNFDEQLIKQMKLLFETADFVKFAKAEPLPDENEWHLKNAYNFVEKTRPKPEINSDSKSKKETKEETV